MISSLEMIVPKQSGHVRQKAPYFCCANSQDSLVLETLATARLSTLPVDKFAYLLCNGDPSDDGQQIPRLRYALIRVYLGAGQARWHARGTAAQTEFAHRALASFSKALENLDKMAPRRQRGLQSAFGSPLDDQKGIDESNEFHSACCQIRQDVIPIMLRLWQAIENETAKPKTAGERKKRLRVLVEKLADWWISVSGRLPAPYVYAKRLDGHPAMVINRQGDFIALALALFCEIDQFKESEVISTVTNVHEDCLS